VADNIRPLLLVVVLLTACVLTGCKQEPKHISSSQFQYEYEMRNQQTMHWAEYLGEKEGNVYLLKKSMSVLNQKKWNKQVLYTGVSELDPEFWLELQQQQQ